MGKQKILVLLIYCINLFFILSKHGSENVNKSKKQRIFIRDCRSTLKPHSTAKWMYGFTRPVWLVI